jgi:hypothetical protein
MTEGALELSVVDVRYILVTVLEPSKATAWGKIQEKVRKVSKSESEKGWKMQETQID